MWSIASLGNEIRYRAISRLLSRWPALAASQPRPYAVEADKPPKTHRCSGRSGLTSIFHSELKVTTSGDIREHWRSRASSRRQQRPSGSRERRIREPVVSTSPPPPKEPLCLL